MFKLIIVLLNAVKDHLFKDQFVLLVQLIVLDVLLLKIVTIVKMDSIYIKDRAIKSVLQVH